MDEKLSAEERALLAADERREARFGYWAAAVVALVLAAGATLLAQVVLSMRYGRWPQVTLADALAFVGIEPGPVSGIVAWVMAWPLWVVLLGLAVAGALLVTRHDRRPVPEALRVARMKRDGRAP